MRADSADASELDERSQEQSYLYDAFISYHHHDRPVAHGIQRGLHRVGRRLGRQLHALRVFRDSTDLSVSPDLWGKVTEAMDRSRYLIAVLSPRAVASTWVNKEITYWLHQRGPGGCCSSWPLGGLVGTKLRHALTRTARMRRFRC
ncbi:MAG TPA: toll/interleukin-1 receptor domain-containing protein [Pseudonocardiaceae bacterium]|nr:toll/interleukin-1 receptor domain-containing protein [Pseudonocardiaceae bacterium]